MAELLVVLSIDPRLVHEVADDPVTRPCPNQTCPFYLAPGLSDPLAGSRERHCPHCGTRFRGRRILSTFDVDHGAKSPAASRVRSARRRLEAWKKALRETCEAMSADGRPVAIGTAFAAVGIPDTANLRAVRLGLVDIVRDAARRQRLEWHSEPIRTSGVSMANWRRLEAAIKTRNGERVSHWLDTNLAFDQQASPRTRASLRAGRSFCVGFSYETS
jgi:hypothetical protein